MSYPKFDNPELFNDFTHILNSLERIKSVEEMSLSGGDFKRPKFDDKSVDKIYEKFEAKEKKKLSSGCALYCYIMQILQIFIGWILKHSAKVLSVICQFIAKIIAKSFAVVSEDFQNYFFDSTQDFGFKTRQFIKKVTITKMLHLVSFILLPPIFAIVKILLIFNKFLLSEIPFE